MSPSEPSRRRVDAALLRSWPLPAPGTSKKSRGDVVVVGGAARSPGGALLAGRAALRVGAGRLTLAIASSVAVEVAVAFPECGVVPLRETGRARIRGSALAAAASDVRQADAVLLGPGLDDIGETREMLGKLTRLVTRESTVVLDAFALGALSGRRVPTRNTILTPNKDEAALLLGRRLRDDQSDIVEIARRYRAVVTCHNVVAAPDGRVFLVEGGGPGLGTSGSGDALAGAIAGLAARGCAPEQAAVWGTFLHQAAGASLARSIAPLGFLASEIVDRFPYELAVVERTP
ncbi:NAD(P)H-hydrate dehydratase [Leifsonia sp. L25]|uniref:NAD(P)H-hydrate dehydratase n=1 Tax=Actinomycetes TaxID=1760 RepID=UPI003D68D55B